MPLRVQCRCGKRLIAPDSAAGKKAKCPVCGEVFLVPQTSPHAAQAARAPGTPRASPAAAVAAAKPAATPKRPAGPIPVAPPLAADPARDERVVAALRSFLPQNDLYVAPDIPPKKVANARAACGIPADERVLGLVNCTVFGSAKNALVFGSRAAYFHNEWSESCRQGAIPYPEFASRTFSDGGARNVNLGSGNQALDVSGSSCSKAQVIAILHAVGRAFRGETGTALMPLGSGAAIVSADGAALAPYVGDPGLVRLAAAHVPLERLRMVGGAFWSTASTAAGRAAKTVLMNVVGGALLATVGIGFFGWAKKTRRAGVIALTDDTLYVLDMGQIAGDDLTLHALKQMGGSPTVATARLSDLAAASTRESGMGALEISGPIALKAYFSDSCTDGNSSVAMNMALAIQAAGGSRVLGGASPQPRLPAPGGPPGVD